MNLSQLLGPNVDPAFVAAAELGSERVQAYVKLLKRHDWHYERNDTSRYLQCSAERKWLHKEQEALDPDAILWNLSAPQEFRK